MLEQKTKQLTWSNTNKQLHPARTTIECEGVSSLVFGVLYVHLTTT